MRARARPGGRRNKFDACARARRKIVDFRTKVCFWTGGVAILPAIRPRRRHRARGGLYSYLS
jgi:hypothetical protein